MGNNDHFCVLMKQTYAYPSIGCMPDLSAQWKWNHEGPFIDAFWIGHCRINDSVLKTVSGVLKSIHNANEAVRIKSNEILLEFKNVWITLIFNIRFRILLIYFILFFRGKSRLVYFWSQPNPFPSTNRSHLPAISCFA